MLEFKRLLLINDLIVELNLMLNIDSQLYKRKTATDKTSQDFLKYSARHLFFILPWHGYRDYSVLFFRCLNTLQSF